jgi:hypothetical protein
LSKANRGFKAEKRRKELKRQKKQELKRNKKLGKIQSEEKDS